MSIITNVLTVTVCLIRDAVHAAGVAHNHLPAIIVAVQLLFLGEGEVGTRQAIVSEKV